MCDYECLTARRMFQENSSFIISQKVIDIIHYVLTFSPRDFNLVCDKFCLRLEDIVQIPVLL